MPYVAVSTYPQAASAAAGHAVHASELAVDDPDLGVHLADPAVHDGSIPVSTMRRSAVHDAPTRAQGRGTYPKELDWGIGRTPTAPRLRLSLRGLATGMLGHQQPGAGLRPDASAATLPASFRPDEGTNARW